MIFVSYILYDVETDQNSFHNRVINDIIENESDIHRLQYDLNPDHFRYGDCKIINWKVL